MEVVNSNIFNDKKGTAHNNAPKNDIAKIVLMCGDPLRAKVTAEEYLKNSRKVNTIRGMYAFTGTYKGVEITVMGHGMGLPSMGIYTYELFKFYDVDTIIRFGTCGALVDHVDVGDVVVAAGASTNSAYGNQFQMPGTLSALADFDLLLKAHKVTKELNIKSTFGNILSSDRFYDVADSALGWGKMNVLVTEMESYALYTNAAYLKKKALAVFTVADHLGKANQQFMTPEERQSKMYNMTKLVLETAVLCSKEEKK